MNKMLVAVFDNENKAYEGLSALKELHIIGDITLYASAVVSKDENGEMHLNTTADEGPVGTATGLLTGSLLGLLGGPIGLAIGATTGSLAGLLYDLNSGDINATFLEEMSNALTNGTTAIIAEIDETWTVPVNTRLEALQAMVFRRLRYEVAEEQLARESEAINAELTYLKEELKEAREEDKEAIKATITKLESKAKAINTLAQKKLGEAKSQMDAKLRSMQEQMKDAGERRQAKIENRIQKLKEEYKVRTEKLTKASRLVGEAFAPVDKAEPIIAANV